MRQISMSNGCRSFKSVDCGLRPSSSEISLPAPANFPLGEDQVISTTSFVLTLRIIEQGKDQLSDEGPCVAPFLPGGVAAAVMQSNALFGAIDFSFAFVAFSRHGEVDDVEPREDAREDRPQDRTIPVPGTYNSDRRTEADPCLSDRVCCRVADLSNDHKAVTERRR